MMPTVHALDIAVADLGLKPNSERDATPIVQQAVNRIIEAGGGTLSFQTGNYHFHADQAHKIDGGLFVSNNQDDFPKWIGITIKEAKNLVIDGAGADFIFHHRMTAVQIEESENVTLRNLSIDYTRPIHTDATLTERNESDFVLRFVPGSTYKITGDKQFRFFVDGELVTDWGNYNFEGKTGRSKYRIAEGGGRFAIHKMNATEIKPGTVRFEGKLPETLAPGDRITFRHNNRNHVAVFIHQSADTTLSDITIHHACAMGVVGQRSKNITIERFRMTPRKGTEHISTAMADATHFSGCAGLLKVTDSHFQGMMDDAINVHGTSLKVIKREDPTTIVAKFMHGQSKGFPIASEGDEIRFIDPTTLLQIGNTCHQVKEAEVIDPHHVRIIFYQPLPEEIQSGVATENITCTPEVLFSGNTVINNRARGMLFNTPRRCIVEKNHVRTSGSAVLVAGDANGWFESGAVGEFGPTIIRDNVFEDCLTNMFQFCRAIISIDPAIPQPSKEDFYHRDIEIENNHFKIFDAPLVFARSVDGLSIKGNTFERTTSFEPWHPDKHAFRFEFCHNVHLSENQVKGDLLSRDIKLTATPRDEVKQGPSSAFEIIE